MQESGIQDPRSKIRNPLLAVVGPTASGKTSLAIRLAEGLGTEIISADSMQFYQGMEVGTGAPTREELARIKHHFVGFLEPAEDFSAGRFGELARRVVDDLNGRGKVAVAVGGSGLYITALIDGLFDGPAKDESIRSRLKAEAHEGGVAALYARLETVDPDYADVIGANDLRRIVRALEVLEITGTPLSVLHRRHRQNAQSLDAVQVALEWPRDQLYARIDARVDQMLEQGLLEEVQALLDHGHGPDIERLRSLGYREMAAHLRGECPLGEAMERMKRNTRRYAKRQLSWFRGDPRIHWLPVAPDKTIEELREQALGLLEGRQPCGP